MEEARRVAAEFAPCEAELTKISKRDHAELSALRQLVGDVPVFARGRGG